MHKEPGPKEPGFFLRGSTDGTMQRLASGIDPDGEWVLIAPLWQKTAP